MEEIDNDPVKMVALSIETLNAIGNSAALGFAQPVCHHFSPYSESESIKKDPLVAPYVERLVKALKDLDSTFDVDAIGGVFGIECWEEIIPSEMWARVRVPQLCEIAQSEGVHYDGWSWEPLGCQAVVASANLSVVRAS